MSQFVEKRLINPTIKLKNQLSYKKAVIATWATLVITFFFLGYTLYFFVTSPNDLGKNLSNLAVLLIMLCFFLLMRYSKNVYHSLIFINLTVLPVLYKSIYDTGGLESTDMGWLLFTVITCTFFVTRTFGLIISIISCIFISWLFSILDAEARVELQKAYFSWLFLILLVTAVVNTFTFFLEQINNRMLQLSASRIEELNHSLKLAMKRYASLRTELGKDFHDEMGNKLATIKMVSESLQTKIALGKEVDIDQELTFIQQNTKELLDGTRDFLWSVDWESNTLVEFSAYLCQFAENILFKFNIRFHINTVGLDNAHEMMLSPKFLRQLLFLCKEVITNAIKHSKAENFHFSIKVNPSQELELTLKDDGIGFDPNNISRKSGIKNITERIEKLEGSVILNTQNGTEYLFKIPLAPFLITQNG